MSDEAKMEDYVVLARKYRPQSFDDLIGQDALVRTLKNAIDSGRVAHAFMLTGVRGVGKTTTARIIAKALNYTGADGQAGPTTGDTADCSIAQAITEDRHPDVMEMDAASRTGVDDIREILDGVRYAPVEARYKIYIIDEVHMLSKAAFNALLKTLEEPPAHVKFIFATTEIRKVPVTILSRCQRFDLARVGLEDLKTHFSTIVEKEGYTIEAEALTSIARAADGSVRDGLSLLDQAMALSPDQAITDTAVAGMLGLGDRALTFSLLNAALNADMDKTLATLNDLNAMGTDPTILATDLLDMVHALMILSVTDGKGDVNGMTGANWPHSEHEAALTLATQCGMPGLNRAWQIILKGLGEMKQAPDTWAALSITLLRLCYTTRLPDPAKLVQGLQGMQADQEGTAPAMTGAAAPQAPNPVVQHAGGQQAQALAPTPQTQTTPQTSLMPTSMAELVALCEEKGALILAQQVHDYAHPITLKPGRFEFHAAPDAPADMAANLGRALTEWTGTRWMVSLSNEKGGKTLAEEKIEQEAGLRHTVSQQEIVKKAMALFPGTEIIEVIPPKQEN